MSVAANCRLVATVAASGDRGATLRATVTNGVEPATYVAEVERGLVDSYEAASIRTGYRIKLAGEWIPDADLVDCEHSWSIDTPVEFLTVNLIGGSAREYAVLATLDTWTLVEIEYWTINGPPGAELEELRFAGYIKPGGTSEAAGAGGPGFTLRIGAVNRIGRLGEFELCHEFEPLAGATRGTIMAAMCADAGLTAVDFPAGAVYTKAIQAKNVQLLAFLLAFVEPEGWKLREIPQPFASGGPLLTATRPAVKDPPLAPDDEWELSRVASFEIQPPADAPSRWVVRGYGAVHVDEHGQQTTVTVTEVFGLYAPKTATHRQAAVTGTITETGFAPQEASIRLVQRIIDTRVERGGKTLSQEVEEWGWYNPRRAKQATSPGVGDGYAFLEVLIDEAGEYVTYPREFFTQVAARRVTWTYDDDGSPIAASTLVSRYHNRTSGVAHVGDADVSIAGVYVFGDSVSYSLPSDVFGPCEQHNEARRFNAVTGAEDEVVLQSFGYVAPRSYVGPDASDDYFVRADGLGQSELTATWRQYAEASKQNLMANGTLQGTVERKYRLETAQMLSGFGRYQWGDYDSNYAAQRLMLTDYLGVQYNVLSVGPGGTYEKVTYRPNADPVREILSGEVPQPRYRTSPWTFLRQEPIELVVTDPVVEQLLGFRREVVQNDHVQSLAEARQVVAERRSRALAYQVRLARHESHLAPGATVFLRRPDDALAHRGWLVSGSERRSRVAPAQTGTYGLEVRW